MKWILAVILFAGILSGQTNKPVHMDKFIERNDLSHKALNAKLDKLNDKFDLVMFTGIGDKDGLVTAVRLNTEFRQDMSGMGRNIIVIMIAQLILSFWLLYTRTSDKRARRKTNNSEA